MEVILLFSSFIILICDNAHKQRFFLYMWSIFFSEIERIESAGRAPPKESKYIDLNKNKPIRVTSRVLVPVKEYPKVRFLFVVIF